MKKTNNSRKREPEPIAPAGTSSQTSTKAPKGFDRMRRQLTRLELPPHKYHHAVPINAAPYTYLAFTGKSVELTRLGNPRYPGRYVQIYNANDNTVRKSNFLSESHPWEGHATVRSMPNHQRNTERKVHAEVRQWQVCLTTPNDPEDWLRGGAEWLETKRQDEKLKMMWNNAPAVGLDNAIKIFESMLLSGESGAVYNSVEGHLNTLTACTKRTYDGQWCLDHAFYMMGDANQESCIGCGRYSRFWNTHWISTEMAQKVMLLKLLAQLPYKWRSVVDGCSKSHFMPTDLVNNVDYNQPLSAVGRNSRQSRLIFVAQSSKGDTAVSKLLNKLLVGVRSQRRLEKMAEVNIHATSVNIPVGNRRNNSARVVVTDKKDKYIVKRFYRYDLSELTIKDTLLMIAILAESIRWTTCQLVSEVHDERIRRQPEIPSRANDVWADAWRQHYCDVAMITKEALQRVNAALDKHV